MYTRAYAFDGSNDRAQMTEAAKALADRIASLHGWKIESVEVTDNPCAAPMNGRVVMTFDDSANPWERARLRFDDSDKLMLIEG